MFWENSWFICLNSRMFHSKVATQLQSWTSASRRWIQVVRSFNPLIRTSQTYDIIWRKPRPQRQVNVYRKIDCLVGRRLGMYQITCWGWTIQPLSWVWSNPEMSTSAKCKSVRRPHPNLQDTPVDLTGAPKEFQMLPGLPGAKQSALRLSKSILKCSGKNLQFWRCIQDATRFDL